MTIVTHDPMIFGIIDDVINNLSIASDRHENDMFAGAYLILETLKDKYSCLIDDATYLSEFLATLELITRGLQATNEMMDKNVMQACTSLLRVQEYIKEAL
ncbi:hypothetical protein [Sulfurimonas marina]|uniref:Uncharacterized protein n=1 Tax=Sulfurimonas marina TaxID=2590551 RepID=A0A7M1AZL3_9BACT|nr:hypothetical protein [Sulfurimonas marina]QOP41812.1 hypothetical protein FJR03_08720 [Sulfurimonas marina]